MMSSPCRFPVVCAFMAALLAQCPHVMVSAFATTAWAAVSSSWTLSASSKRTTTTTTLHGISEWRDDDFGLPGGEAPVGVSQGNRGTPKRLCLLPFPYEDVLLQGETKQLRLYEDRFIKLFEDVMDNHHGVVGMGLIAQSGVIQTVPLCEVEAFNRMEGFGIFVTIRVVGRAQLMEISQQEPYLRATAVELTDHLPPNLELPNLMCGQIENTLLLLSSMERRLNEAVENDEMIEDKDMQRRVAIAKLEDRFYTSEDDEDETDDDDGDEEASDVFLDRLGRYRKAYETALASDTQGYQIQVGGQDKETDLSPAEITATSWAAFCTELVPREEATYRIQAMDADHLFDRLKLAVQMLRELKERLREKMQKADLRGEDLDEDEPSLDA